MAAASLCEDHGRSGAAQGIGEARILGYRIHPFTKTELLETIFAPRTEGQQIVIASANLHGMFMHERYPVYRCLHQRAQTLVIVDGMPVIWLLKLFGHRVGRDHRTTWVDWFEDALDRAAATGSRVYILGHTKAVLSDGLRKAALRWPHLVIEASDGFFGIEDRGACAKIIDKINAFRPDILFVGMGMPRQEHFAAEYAARIDAPVIGLGGAAFAYFAGDQTSPPRWMGRAGLEWAHRLASNPRRLAVRYLVEPFLLAFAIAVRLAREFPLKVFPVEAAKRD